MSLPLSPCPLYFHIPFGTIFTRSLLLLFPFSYYSAQVFLRVSGFTLAFFLSFFTNELHAASTRSNLEHKTFVFKRPRGMKEETRNITDEEDKTKPDHSLTNPLCYPSMGSSTPTPAAAISCCCSFSRPKTDRSGRPKNLPFSSCRKNPPT